MELCVDINSSLTKMVAPSISQEISDTVLDYLNINGGIVSLKNPDLVLTNRHFLQICKEKDKFNLTWPNLSVFFTSLFKYPISRVMLIKCLQKSKDFIAKLNRAKNFDLTKYFLSSALSFIGAFPDVVDLSPSDACSTPTSIHNSEIVPNQITVFVSSDLNLQIANDDFLCSVTPNSVVYTSLGNDSENFLLDAQVNEVNLPVSSLDKKLPILSDDLIYQIKKYKQRINHLKLQNRQINKRCNEYKKKYQAILSKYNVRNVNKREVRKDCRINQLLQKNIRLEKEIDLARKRSQSDRQKAWYFKKKIENTVLKTSDETNDSILMESLNYFENLSEELKERVDFFEKNVIDVFEGGRYNDEIRSVYYDLLSKNVSVNNVESVIRTVLQKMAGISCGTLPKKSLAAEFFSEMNLLSKAQVREAILNSTHNFLHTDGTKYNFREIGSFQVTTSSGSYTFGIEDMFSGEAQSYFGELKNLLTDMSQIFSPEKEKYEDDLRKLIFSFKSLMTDRTIVNSSFFKQFKHWREAILPFVVENYDRLPLNEKLKISQMHHVFCGLHVIHNLGIYAEKAIIEWEKVVEQEGSIHGGFINSENSRTFDILSELSKLTSYRHGDQWNGKADEWRAFLRKKFSKSFMVSFLHHRFNIIFLLGGATYFHKDHLKEFVFNLDGSNFLHESIRHDIDNIIFQVSTRALGNFNKLISGPLFCIIEEEGHIFSLNTVWSQMFNYFVCCSSDASIMLSGSTFFDVKYLTKDELFDCLFSNCNDPLLDALTQECLEVICCSCSVMIQSQLRDQLPGGKYHNPDVDVLEETQNCPRTNVVSERDFASYDRMLKMKPNMTTVAAAGVIMYVICLVIWRGVCAPTILYMYI
ncbi:uncharacterized protein LOC136090527 [Hydra vulgaris]|uniref:Uncharacterized protein LOC136090527 n=1 Tax=Hydra vulgaris TaxID=6087 RepID=A0ABM4DG02_HYDVU